MIKRMIILAIGIILIFSATGCKKEVVTEKLGVIGKITKVYFDDKGMIADDIEKKPEEETIPEVDSIEEKISTMTLDEKIGQMFIVGLEGYSLGNNSKSLIEEYKVGGFILFEKNIQNAEQLLSLINSLKTENATNKIPLFFSVDEEGGMVTRIPKEFKRIPTNKVIGQINNREFSYNIGKIIGNEIKSFGFNMNFAPVLDIDSNAKNPVIGNRAFGTNSDIVKSLGVETMKGMEEVNVIPVVKHFPGHGDTSEDSHVGLPRVDKDLKNLKNFELIPFKEAINKGADAIMIAHILLPKMDNENPSSMSKRIITDILRDDLQFNGVVITDDMTMGAISENYDITDASLQSIKAGSDIILVCHGYDNEIKVINAVKEAVLKGEITEDRIDESVYRILKLKEKYNLKNEVINSIDVYKINKKISELLEHYM